MRRTLLVVLAILAAPSAAAAGEPVCPVPGPEARAEKQLREDMRQRARYGFRADRAYVRSLTTRSRQHLIPVTPAEERYLDRRAELRLGARASRYLRDRPAISAWWDVRDDWPRGAYVAVFIADDPAEHRAAIRRRAAYPRATRVVRVRYSDRELRRVSDRIERDVERLDRAGFHGVETDLLEGTDRVDVSLATSRADHAAYFKRRYGAMVRTRVISTRREVPYCVDASSFEIAPDGLSVTVSWQDGPAAPHAVEVVEGADRVSIGIVDTYELGTATTGESGGTASVRLRAQLGSRAVYDANDGARLLQRGPSPGDPPCPVLPERTPLESAIRERARYGMHTDPAYVQALLADDRTYTEHERRWLKTVQRVDFDSNVHDYVHSNSEDWGGSTLVADYPAKPYVLVRFLRRLAFHEKRLKRVAKYPGLLRIERSTVQRDVFYELPLHIGDDARELGDGFFDGYGRDGFFLAQADGDESTQTVEVRVITTRTDAAEYFARRYGPLVRVTVIGDRFECDGSYSW